MGVMENLVSCGEGKSSARLQCRNSGLDFHAPLQEAVKVSLIFRMRMMLVGELSFSFDVYGGVPF